ncbi:FliC flagellin [Candidatus Cyrtobacter comes]|uniref:FliC flagellin n=1 Tax=Candidatus Cyrtobacter comes TaxID=675776 RepID=A0ABU5L8W2_9RICK|nr:hypothetical protein [Candidatus Cyrtobacter comes]MDZ5762554.1 FliC flagellin [Candidatus Cyrtobacter comes]
MSSITLNNRAIGSTMGKISGEINNIAKQISTGKNTSNPASVIIASKAEFSRMISENTASHLNQGVVVAEFGLNSIETLTDSLDTSIKNVHELLNGSLSQDAQESLYTIIERAFAELERVAVDAEFNGRKLLNGDSAGAAGSIVDTSGVSGDTSAYSTVSLDNIAAPASAKTITLHDKVKITVDSSVTAEGVTEDVQTSGNNVVKFQFRAGGAAAIVADFIKIQVDNAGIDKFTIATNTIGGAVVEGYAAGVLTLNKDLFDTAANVEARVDAAVSAINGASALKDIGLVASKEGTDTLVIKKKEDLTTPTAKGIGDEAIKAIYGGVTGTVDYLSGVKIGNTSQASVDNMTGRTVTSNYDDVSMLTYAIKTGTGAEVATKIATFINNISLQNNLSNDVISKIEMLDASSVGTTLTLKSKEQGQAGAFSFPKFDGTTAVSSFDVGAKSGSLGASSVGAQGSLGVDSMIKNISQKSSYTDLATIAGSNITDGAYLNFFGRTITFKNTVTDSTKEIQIVSSSPSGTMANLAKMLNNSSDPTFKNYIFTSYVDNSGAIRFGARSRTYNSEMNGKSFNFTAAGGGTLATLTFANGATGGIDVSHVTENKDFIGKLSGLTASYNGLNKVTLNLKVGSTIYSGQVSKTNNLDDQTVVMSAQGGKGGYFTLGLVGGKGADVSSVAQAEAYATYINKELEKITFYQTLDMQIVPTAGGVLDGSGIRLTTGDGSKTNKTTNVTVNAATTDKAGTISVEMEDGRTFSSSSDRSLINAGNLASKSLAVAGDLIQKGQILILSSDKDENERMTITFSKSIDLTNKDDVLALQSELANALKAGESDFKFILPSGETISIEIPDMRGKALLNGQEWSDLKYDTVQNRQNTLTTLMNVKTTILQAHAKVGAMVEAITRTARHC